MGCGWQADWVMAKIFLSNLHRHMMIICWKCQEDISILVWVRAEWLKICCNNRPPLGKHQQATAHFGQNLEVSSDWICIDILIHVWFRAKRLKICCNNRPPLGNWCWCLPGGGLLLEQIFSLLALNQTWIKISAWNFQHLFISCLCKFETKILAVAQSACQPRPISAKTLDASSNHICWNIWKRKKLVRF